MPTTLAQLAKLVEGRLVGPGDLPIVGAATLEVAQAGEITLADSKERDADLANSAAAAAIASEEVSSPCKPTIVVDDVHQAFAQVVSHFRPRRIPQPVGISPEAFISPTAQIAEGVDIHPGASIGEEAILGSGTTIHSGARVMAGCQLGSGVTIFPNVVLYDETRVGDRSTIHAGAVIGANGFGYREQEGRHEISAQLGYVEIGADVEIGACATVDRGTYGPTLVGDGTKVDNLVQIAHNCRLGKHNLICSQVGIAGSATTGDYVVMAGQAGLRDHVHVGERAIVGSKAGVSTNVEAKEIVLGQPATPIRRQKVHIVAIAKLPEMRKEFRAVQRELAALQQQLNDYSVESLTEKTGDQAA